MTLLENETQQFRPHELLFNSCDLKRVTTACGHPALPSLASVAILLCGVGCISSADIDDGDVVSMLKGPPLLEYIADVPLSGLAQHDLHHDRLRLSHPRSTMEERAAVECCVLVVFVGLHSLVCRVSHSPYYSGFTRAVVLQMLQHYRGSSDDDLFFIALPLRVASPRCRTSKPSWATDGGPGGKAALPRYRSKCANSGIW